VEAVWTIVHAASFIGIDDSDVAYKVYRFMTRDIATVAVQLGFVSSVYMDITKSVRSAELIALLDFCRHEKENAAFVN
jgi:hypothetical protein